MNPSRQDMEFFRRIDPRKGFLYRHWNPVSARRIDRLINLGLIYWSSEGMTRSNFGFRIILTPKGKIVRNKL